ncbi:MerR family DNA-binding protein [Sphingomonas bacterium]|uniref:MerR family DNA-binding protein n=1 Tax=Sphingomonas bacterium TaxID=1895847 RepID=UPI001C2D4F18|nr:MerR family DNA-binding protein [Sphingomonas bacterium]
MGSVTIGGLAREGGVGVETIRFYQRRGLLATPEKGGGQNAGYIRRYGQEDRRRLRFIRSAQAAGFTLEQIGELLALDATQDRHRARELAKQQLIFLDDRIAELNAVRDSLTRLARRCGENSPGPCPIIAAFDSDHAGAVAGAS